MDDTEDYITIALRNITQDRERLEKLYDELDETGVNPITRELDPIIRMNISEHLVKVIDSLTKQTGQIVELAKLSKKIDTKQSDSPDGISATDRDNIFSVIETATKGVADA